MLLMVPTTSNQIQYVEYTTENRVVLATYEYTGDMDDLCAVYDISIIELKIKME